MQLLNQFGFDPMLFTAQIVNFLVIYFVLKKFLYKPILAMLQKRERTIKEGLKQAQEAEKILAHATKKEQEILTKAQNEARKMIDDSKQHSAELIKNAELQSKQQMENMLKETREQIAFETKETEKRLTAHVSQLAIEFLQKSVGELFGEKEQELIMKNALSKLKKRID